MINAMGCTRHALPIPATRAECRQALRLLGPLMLLATCLFSAPGRAQVDYVARFRMEKPRYLLGEPVFCVFTIQNTGKETFAFRFRSPSRVLNPELEGEPRFQVRNARGKHVADPAPQPCGGAPGTAVYGSVTLPSGQTHTERWLLDQWARFSAPGEYHVRAERRLPLLGLDPRTQEFSEKPLAFALALDELSFEIAPASEAQLRPVFAPFLEALKNPATRDPAEAVLVVTTLPHAFFLSELETMAGASAPARWDRKQALEGLARLGSPAAWRTTLRVAQGRSGKPGEEVRAYAVLLLAEKGNPAFLPPLLKLAAGGPASLRGDVLRALGFFNDPRASRAIFDRLHSANATDRMNAILGLKNLGTRESIPALLAMLNDPEPQVRQVANFALTGLTGLKFLLPEQPSRADFARVSDQWHAWWQKASATFTPLRPPACHDW